MIFRVLDLQIYVTKSLPSLLNRWLFQEIQNLNGERMNVLLTCSWRHLLFVELKEKFIQASYNKKKTHQERVVWLRQK